MKNIYLIIVKGPCNRLWWILKRPSDLPRALLRLMKIKLYKNYVKIKICAPRRIFEVDLSLTTLQAREDKRCGYLDYPCNSTKDYGILCCELSWRIDSTRFVRYVGRPIIVINYVIRRTNNSSGCPIWEIECFGPDHSFGRSECNRRQGPNRAHDLGKNRKDSLRREAY